MLTTTPRQVAFIRKLITEREVDHDDLAKLSAQAERLDKDRASKWIERLLSLPRKKDESQVEIACNVPAGRYAVTGNDGTTDFYRVDCPERGRWAGYVFVSLQVSDDFQRVPRSQVQTVLDRIEEAGPEEAAKRYGRELGICSVCGRTLTNNDSIRAGIGPVCASRNGWNF